MRDVTDHLSLLTAAINSNRLAEVAPALFAEVPLDITAPTAGDPVAVVANHGRWVVECPDCHMAQLAHPVDQRFLCNACGNVGNGRNFRPVTWPKDHEKIAELLDQRADVTLRNWSPGETVGDLKAENEILAAGPALLDQPWTDPKWFDLDNPHTHRYPKALPDDLAALLECRDCGFTAPAHAIKADRDAGLKGAK